MTRTEWDASTDVATMLDYVDGKVDNRKLTLFSIACLRRIWHLVTDDRSRRLVEATERYADDIGAAHEACEAYELFSTAWQSGDLHDAAGDNTHQAVECVAHIGTGAAIVAASECLEAVGFSAARELHCSAAIAGPDWSESNTEASRVAKRLEAQAQVSLARDIFGDLFATVTVKRARLPHGITDLAKEMYLSRCFERMPLLCERLRDAGWDAPDVSSHCATFPFHYRGCWVIDMVLGKALE